MTIIIAENFQQDTQASLMQRYPGTYNPAVPSGAIVNGFPIGCGAHWLQFGKAPFDTSTSRIEIRMTFPGPGVAATAAGTLNIFGLTVTLLASEGGIQIGGNTLPSLRNKTSFHIILDLVGSLYKAVVLMDDVVVMTPKYIATFVPQSWIGISDTTNTYRSSIPNHINSIVVATGTTVGTRLSGVTFTKKALTVTDPGAWTFTSVGYVEDTDKQDPTITTPGVEVIGASSLQLGITGYTGDTNLYLNKFADDIGFALQLDGFPNSTSTSPTAVPVRKASSGAVSISTPSLIGFSNGDVTFVGESSLITYADLCTAVGFSDGTLNTDAGWLEFYIDGQHVFVAKNSVRYNVSWDQIYAAGLVYGTDDFGSYPTGTPTLQNKTVTVSTTSYRVRLLRGADTDPYVGISDADPVGSQRSEWARLMYPICTGSHPSYTGPALASYTEAQLGLGATITFGRAGWTADVYSGTRRTWVGSGGVSTVSGATSDTLNAASGWRPILIQIP